MASIDAPTVILTPGLSTTNINDKGTYEMQRESGTAIGIAVCTGEVITRLRESGGVMEAITPGLFMMPDGDKEYNTFLEMLRDQPKMEDPVFKDGEVSWTVEDAGAPLDKLDENDAEFKKMYEEMFSKTNELGTMGAGEFELRLIYRQNELSNSRSGNINGGVPSIVSSGGSTVHSPQRPSTPLYPLVSGDLAGAVVSVPAEGSYASDSKTDDGSSWSSVDA